MDDDPRLARVTRLAHLLDSRFRLPGTAFRVGWDGILGLVPGIGDAATALTALYIVAEAKRLGVRKRTLLRMLFNVAMDGSVGSVPLIGDLFDFMWKANRRNIRLIREDLERQARIRPVRPGG